ncbi:hydantoinase B/oxoprolinase family protein [Virgibacillus dakarensis]|uniref:hydantoinase B/oxoprolinase family protein n=1 Tax=Virgibacillus dakarensis TaxID=1917889 RepID=UPI000B44E22E|nr:hydantoinase B/oxoprolinase family protein [Virgibacillus dakarensis]MTW84494.1 hydantoinase B/oxoprolinase family protein [Virgibacillus dakarensis]
MSETKTPIFLENPVTTEIIRNALISAAEEMNESLARSSFSPIIYEMKDCSVGIYNENAELLGQSSGLPMFLGNLDVCIRETTNFIGGNDNYKPGDIYIMNDSYLAGSHLNDITIISPIFYDDYLVGFSATRAHWLDIGAKDPGYPMDAIEIYQEGVRIPPTKIYDAGEPRKDIIQLITMNSRLSNDALGDMNAQIAACRTGEKRVYDIIRKHSLDTFRRSIKDIFKQSEIMDKEQISSIPDGVYEEEGYLDNDGVTDDPVLVKVKVTIAGDRLTIDLTGSSEQRQGMTNCGLAQTVSACRVAFKHLIGPDSPVTGGNFKTMDIIVPKRTIFSAEEPAACGWYFTSLGLLIDLIVKALSPVLKEQSAAAHYGDSMVITVAGHDKKSNSTFLYVEPTAGGWGAFSANDGQSGLINNSNGDFKNLPVEVLEGKYPLKINSYLLRENSGGAGKTRGGLGVTREYELRTNANLSLWFERSKTPGWGLFGGQSGKPPIVTVKTSNGEEDILKVNAKPLSKGDCVIVKTGGGGGFGNPLERPLENVLEDIIDGYIDADTASKEYGVTYDSSTVQVHRN